MEPVESEATHARDLWVRIIRPALWAMIVGTDKFFGVEHLGARRAKD